MSKCIDRYNMIRKSPAMYVCNTYIYIYIYIYSFIYLFIYLLYIYIYMMCVCMHIHIHILAIISCLHLLHFPCMSDWAGALNQPAQHHVAQLCVPYYIGY